jgi:hypothetical protein
VTSGLLIHVEDPGAANWIAALVPALAAHGIAVTLVADGHARAYLAERGIACRDDAAAAPDLLDCLRPLAVLVGTSENADSRGLALIDAGRAAGIPTAAIVDQPANAEHRFRGRDRDPLRHAPDRVVVPDRRTADAFTALGLPLSRIAVTGNPHHDRVRTRATSLAREGQVDLRARLFPDVAASRPLVVFIAEVGYVVNPEAEDWERENRFRGRGTTRYRTAVILEEVLDALALRAPRPALVLRLHPKNVADEFAAYRDEIAAMSQGGDPLAVIFAADLVVGMTSALLEEAQLMGCRCLAVLPRAAERNWLAGLADDRIPAVESRAALREALPALLAPRNGIAATPAEPALPRLIAVVEAMLRPAQVAKAGT